MAKITTYGALDRTFEPRPEGYYDLQIESVEITESPRTGKPQARLRASVLRHDAGRVAPGTQINVFMSLTEGAVPFLVSLLEAAGVEYERLTSPATGISWDPEDLVGRCVRGRLSHRLWNDVKREQWSDWSASELGPTQEDVAEAAQRVAEAVDVPNFVVPPNFRPAR